MLKLSVCRHLYCNDICIFTCHLLEAKSLLSSIAVEAGSSPFSGGGGIDDLLDMGDSFGTTQVAFNGVLTDIVV